MINDTVGFANSNWPGLANNQVGLAYYESLVEGDASCDIGESAFDESILGMVIIPTSPWLASMTDASIGARKQLLRCRRFSAIFPRQSIQPGEDQVQGL